MPEEKVKKLDRLLALLDPEESLTKSDFTEAFKKVIELVQTILAKHEAGIKDLQETYQMLLKKVGDEYNIRHNELKGQVDNVFVGDQIKRIDSESKMSHAEMKQAITDAVNKKMEQMDNETEEMKEMLYGETKKKKDEMDLYLKTIQYNGKLDADKAITAFKEDYKKDIKELKDLLQRINSGRSQGTGRAKVYFQQWVDLTASVDGSTTVFNLPADTVRVHGLLSTQFPQLWRTTDYSLAGNKLTTNFTMQSGASLIAVCEVLFYNKL